MTRRVRIANRLGFFLLGILPCLCLAVDATRAYSWEISTMGQFSYVFEHYSQNVDAGKGFFGPANRDVQFGGRFASVRSYLGHQLEATTASCNDGSTAYQRLDLQARLKVNKAVRLTGRYHLGQYLNGEASDYRSSTRPGTRVAASDGQWTLWWLDLLTPHGNVTVGKKPWVFGLGLNAAGGAGDSTEETLLLALNYGPFSFGSGIYLSRRADEGYWNEDDKNNIRFNNNRQFFVYRNGPLDFGTEITFLLTHRGAERELVATANKTTITRDLLAYTVDVYLRYFNGRFFFNGELVRDYETVRYQPNANVPDVGDGRGSRYASDYIDSWRYMIETGFIFGPAKLSFLYAHMPGPDRRQGLLIDKQPFAPGTGYPVFIPYSFLLGYAYGAGIDAFDLNEDGYINAATVYGARLDYAVACNLNLHASLMSAKRAGHGYGWGFIDLDGDREINAPDGANVGGVPVRVQNPNYGQVLFHNTDENGGRLINAINIGAPNIPDTALGWEFTTGIDWKILEGTILAVRYARWVPGKWFSYACIDKSVANRGTPDWGVNPGRDVGPIFALTMKIIASF